jgi:O-antigen/teichoic acid export membrane protein
VDVIVARNVLTLHDAGLYAGGVILTKATLFLPQFVVVVAFPEMSSETSRRHALTRSLMLVAALGAATTIGTWLLPDLALIFVGGSAFQEISGRLWAFAVIGSLLSLLQLLVYFVLARRSRRSAVLPWIALVILILVGLTVDTLDSLILAVIAVDAALFALLLAISLIRIGPDRAPEGVSVGSIVPTAPGSD